MPQIAKRVVETGHTHRVSRPIDLVHLARQSLGDRMLEAEILRMYDRLVEQHFETVNHPEQCGNVAHALHALKGASAGVGAFGVSDIARDAEQELAASGAPRRETISDLEMKVVEVRQFIAGLLADVDAEFA